MVANCLDLFFYILAWFLGNVKTKITSRVDFLEVIFWYNRFERSGLGVYEHILHGVLEVVEVTDV